MWIKCQVGFLKKTFLAFFEIFIYFRARECGGGQRERENLKHTPHRAQSRTWPDLMTLRSRPEPESRAR